MDSVAKVIYRRRYRFGQAEYGPISRLAEVPLVFDFCFPLLKVDFNAPFESSNGEYRKHDVDDFFAALSHLESTAPPEIYVLLSVSFDRSTAGHRLKSELYSAVPRYQVFLSPDLRDAVTM